MALTDSEARDIVVSANPALAQASPRTMQGLLGVSRALSNYGYRFSGQNDTDHNWGSFVTPQGVPCALPNLPIDVGGGQKMCVIAFSDDTEGVNTFVDALSSDPAISVATTNGDVNALAQALLASPAFAQQSAALYGNAQKLAMYLAIGIVKISEATGQAPDWYADGVRVDQAIANANQGGTNTPAGNGPTQTPTATDDGLPVGKIAVAAVAVVALGYGLSKLAKRGPR